MSEARTMIDLAFVIGNLNKEHGGAQRLLYDICRHLPQSEFKTTVYYMFGEGSFQDEFKSHGTQVVALNAASNHDITAFRRLVGFLRKDEHTIVHTNSPISGVWGRVAGVVSGIEHVVSVEHNVHTAYKPHTRTANGATLPLADAIVGVSRTVSESLLGWERWLLPKSTLRKTIRNGVDVEAIRSSFEQSEPVLEKYTPFSPTDTIIGTMGRLHEQKGFRYLLSSFPEIKRHHEDAKLLVLGGGPRKEKLRQLADETGHAGDICLTGYVPDVYPFLPSFDVAVYPSLWEGFGLTPIEAMAAQRPIVASDIETFREIVGDAGILVEPGNADAIAAAVSSLLENAERRSKLSQRGYEHTIENYSIQRTVDEYASLYRTLTNE